jgi:hypothetical protein
MPVLRRTSGAVPSGAWSSGSHRPAGRASRGTSPRRIAIHELGFGLAAGFVVGPAGSVGDGGPGVSAAARGPGAVSAAARSCGAARCREGGGCDAAGAGSSRSTVSMGGVGGVGGVGGGAAEGETTETISTGVMASTVGTGGGATARVPTQATAAA